MKLLASMGLVEASAARADEPEQRTVYTIQPAVRDGFRSSLDRETALASHGAAREGLGSVVRGGNLAMKNHPTTRLSICSKRSFTTQFPAGTQTEAWEIFKSRIGGGFTSLDWRLGQFDRGRTDLSSIRKQPMQLKLSKRTEWLRQSWLLSDSSR